MALRLHEACKRFRGPDGPVTALDTVSLDVGAGAVIAICGPSGCGKSTLLLTAGTLLAPDRGADELDGERPYALSEDARAALRSRKLGFVFQQFHLVPYMSVLDNVLLPSLAVRDRTDQPGVLRHRACELLDRFGLTGRLGHTPAQLSTGERQRCGLARALLNRPRFLLADEPTGSLDEANTGVVLAALREFAAGGGGVLVVTHDASVAALADATWWMEHGRLRPAARMSPKSSTGS